MESPMAPPYLLLCDLERSIKVIQISEFIISKKNRIRPYTTIKHL